jgi:hypothetical protein
LDQAHEDIRAAGGDVVAIFQYRAQPTRHFCRRRGVGFDCLGDPQRRAYAEVGLERGSWREVVGPQLTTGFLRAASRGAIGGLPQGDVRQRPGTFVVASDGAVLLAHYNRDSADNAKMDTVLGALRGEGEVG